MDSGLSGSIIQTVAIVIMGIFGIMASVIGTLILARLKKIEDMIDRLTTADTELKTMQARFEERFTSLYKFKERVERKLGWSA